MNFLLTIGIPTYNRVEDLAQCLDSIRHSWKPEFEGLVELLISSNASTDGTDEFLTSWSQAGLPLRIHRWDDNVGPIANFLKIVELAEGTYCWLLSDDDAIEPSALSDIVTFISSNPRVGGVTLEANAWNSDLTGPLSPPEGRHSLPGLLPSKSDIWTECLHDWGLLSICVFDVKLWRECLESCPIPKGDAYPHVWLQAEMARRNPRWGYQSYPVIRWRMDRDSFLKSNGALKRALMPVDSYGGIAAYYRRKDPPLARAALQICCGTARHYIRRFKSEWISDSSARASCFSLLAACARKGGWRCPAFYVDTLPSFLFPSLFYRIALRLRK